MTLKNQLDRTQPLQNKDMFLELVNSISRDNMNKEMLLNMLTNESDFFTAPASIKHHSAFEGGLCYHSLLVYDNLYELAKLKEYTPIDKDSLIITGLFHDISKTNYYSKSLRNVKVNGEWVQVPCYKVRDSEELFIYGNQEETSERIISTYIPLYLEESCALLNSKGGLAYDSVKSGSAKIFEKYKLPVLLHTADMLATYIDERNN